MNKALFLTCIISLLLSTTLITRGQTYDDLAGQFLSPPDPAKPWIMLFWISDFVTKEAITHDLEAYHRVGVGGVLLFPNYEHIDGWGFKFAPASRALDRPQPLSDEWYEHIRHTILECNRLGMKIAFHNEPGYSGAGGPWITPEYSMRKLVDNQVILKGPGPFTGNLPAAPGLDHRDVAVLACRIPDPVKHEGKDPIPVATASSSLPDHPLENIRDGNEETFWSSSQEIPGQGVTPWSPEWISFQYDEPFTAGAVLVTPRPKSGPNDCQIQWSVDGEEWKTIEAFSLDHNPVQIEFEPITARHFRLLINSSYVWEDTQIIQTAMLKPGQNALTAVAENEIFDLTERLNANGQLNWEVPDGRWRILRFGHVSTGKKIHPASPIAEGFESDKMSVLAVRHHFENGMIGRILDLEPQLNGTTVAGVELDSYEGGGQDWSPAFREEFKMRRGYDPLLWLPAWSSGVIIENEEMTERFRYDMHLTIAELHADNYYNTAAAFCAERNVQLYTEAYGTELWDPLTNANRADVPMAEFWMEQSPGQGSLMPLVRLMSSAAHTTGKTLVTAESFTYRPANNPWWIDPYALKAVGDQAYCMGLNHNVLSESALQVWLDRVRPGMTFDAWGTPFNPNQTWWEPGRAWMAYQARCHALLQLGRPLADILTLAPFVPGQNNWNTPGGIDHIHHRYDYDFCAEEVFLKDARYENGRIILPGVEYSLLTLVNSDRLHPRTLSHIAELAEAGATILGGKPAGAPGRVEYPDRDQQVRELADRLWGQVDGRTVTANQVGKGRIIFGRHSHEVLQEMGLPPDLDVDDLNIHWTHRRYGDFDIYFLSNQEDMDCQVDAVFRVAGKRPELWDPVTGGIRPLPEFRQTDVMTVPLRFAPYQSYFVIFRPGTGGKAGRNFPELEPVMTLEGPWEVSFDRQWGGPGKVTFEKLEDWTARPEEGIRYYSGTATYSKQFDVTAVQDGSSIFLDLGTMKNLAEVSLNGQPLGIIWCPPWQVQVPAGLLRAEDNQLEIRITNTWVNRLIGDELQPDDALWSEPYTRSPFPNQRIRSLLEEPQWLAEGTPRPSKHRYAFATYKHLYADDKLLPSGLFGPVRILIGKE